MTATSDEDYGRRERLLLQSTSTSSSSQLHPGYPTSSSTTSNNTSSSSNSSNSSGNPQYPPGERFSGAQERFPNSQAGADRYPPAAGNGAASERFPPATNATLERPPAAAANGFQTTNGNGYASSPAERYTPERFANAYPDRYIPPPAPSERCSYLQERYFPPDRYPPPPPAPNERYVPDRYNNYQPPPSPNYLPNGFIQATTPAVNPGDPYMRRDLGYHHHYRLQHPNYHQQQQQQQQQQQHYHHYHHRALPPPASHRYHQHHLHLRCTANSAPNTVAGSREYLLTSPRQQRTSVPVEYVGASGGRHVSTPPLTGAPVLPRCASMSNCDVGHHRRGVACDKDGSTLSLCCGSNRRYLPDKVETTPSHVTTLPHHTSVWRAVGQTQVTPQPSPPQGSTPVVGTSPTATPSSPTPSPSTPSTSATPTPSTASPSTSSQHAASSVGLERSLSAPEPAPTAPAGAGNARPPLQRSISRSEVVKNFIRRETAVFFGIEEDCEKKEQALWLERRKRLACRKYGSLRDEFIVNSSSSTSPRQQVQPPSAYDTRPDVLPVGRDSTDLGRDNPRWSEPPVRRKESVAKMTFGGLAYVVTALTRPRPRPTPRCRQYSRSYPLAVIPEASALVNEHSPETFFDRPESIQSAALTTPGQGQDVVDAGHRVEVDPQSGGFPVLDEVTSREQHVTHEQERPMAGWKRMKKSRTSTEAVESGPEVGCSRIWSRVLDRVFDNSDRRQYGMGFVGRFFGRSMKRSVRNQSNVAEQLDNIEDYRPFFTYWITTVQILILFISLFCYGLGPIGFDLNNRSGEVLVTSLSLQQVEYQEPANFWIGPRAGDLIHLGAKFAPCMRKDAKIIKEIEKGREKERETACCIRNDDSGCVQSSQADCSKTISTWKKWSSGDSGPGGRISGSVCGLDPKHCESPASVAPYEWPDDITKWPICRKTKTQNFRPRDKVAEHMVCEVIGHPCCIGIHGMCRITTKEYCDFVRGYFHEEASLCSQVSCLDDVCGMIPFYSPEVPDQFYRLWTSLFLHAGVGHLAITLMIQWFLMRDLEKLTGPLRIGIIYMGSGIAGNLASAIFVPYRAEVGPAGAQFGLLACLIVEVLNVWPMLRHPDHALLKLLSITLVLFLFGLLPWVDNYAHLFGFIFGFLLSYALMPFVSFGPYDRHKKTALIWVCLLSSLFLFTALVVLFYVIPVYDCEVCNYFTCLPLTRDFCASQNINFRREEPVV